MIVEYNLEILFKVFALLAEIIFILVNVCFYHLDLFFLGYNHKKILLNFNLSFSIIGIQISSVVPG